MAVQTLHPPDLVPLDPVRVREDFPILSVRPHGKRLVYLDNAATTQKPRQVIDAIRHYYERENANVHRGVHHLSERATEAFESARKKVQRFFNIPLSCEVVFTRGATESVNLVAQSYGRAFLREGDEIVLTHMEHHSNIVPWQMVCQEKGARIRVAPINERGELLMDDFAALLNERTRLVSVVHVSNALGTVNPVRDIIRMARERHIPVLLDGAQSAPHMPVDVQELGCDFFVCSGHKMYGPTGIGVLYGRGEWLDRMPPWQGGGDMIMSVSFEKTSYNTAPFKFEAGTPNIAGAVGLGAAVDYLSALGMDRVAAHEQELLEHGTRLLSDIPGVRLIGTAARKAGVLSFVMDTAHPHDIGQILDEEGIAIRAGHHCAQPVMNFYGVPATARASLGVYTTREDLDALAEGIRAVKEMFD
jgi:cysteine desulfurase / selenocysteine lyase